MNSPNEQHSENSRQTTTGFGKKLRSALLGSKRLLLAVVVCALILATVLVGFITNLARSDSGHSAPPASTVGEDSGHVLETPGPGSGEESQAEEALLSPQGLVLPPRTDDPAKFATYAGLALNTWDTTRVTRGELLQAMVGFASPTPEWEGLPMPSRSPMRENQFFVNKATERLPDEQAWSSFAAARAVSSAQPVQVLVDDQIVAFRDWTPRYRDVTGPETGTHLVTVTLAVTMSSQAGESGPVNGTAEQHLSFEVQCDPSDSPSRGQCGIIYLHKDPIF